MNYKETLEYLYNQTPQFQRVGQKAYKEGLDNSLRLDEYFQHPHHNYHTIHVGGTNGKGSVSHLLAAVLQSAGYKVGLYTSPHLIDFRERIRVNGAMISKQFVIDFVATHRAAFEPIMPSFFELTMEMAFLYFAAQNIDVAVIEVGLGGRLDSTNIISPDLSIITNIGFDHMQYLGDTLPKIASEKAGIIKPYTPIVVGECDDNAVEKIFLDAARKNAAPIIFAEKSMQNLSLKYTEKGWTFVGADYSYLNNPLRGFAQKKNSKTVLAAVEELRKLDYQISESALFSGFKNVVLLTGLKGRWQQIGEHPRVVCDTAHNAHGIRYVVQQLKAETYNRLHIVFGMVNDKDSESVLALMPSNATYYFTKPSIERALDEQTLAQKAATYELYGNCYDTVPLAIHYAKENADKNDFIFIGGSSFVVADALKHVQK